jgi:YD repeat-containing protein
LARSVVNMMTKAKDCESAIPALFCALSNHDTMGNTVSMKQNPFDQISQLVDPTGNVTTLNYDARRLSSRVKGQSKGSE